MVSANAGGARSAPVFRGGERDGFAMQWVEDGSDYPAILEEFWRGRIQGDRLAAQPDRETFRVKVGERTLVIKRSMAPFGRPRRRLWELVSGTAFSRLFRETWAAIGRGCDFIPEIYLVAEKYAGHRLCVDSYLIAQYIEGEVLGPGRQPSAEWLEALGDTVGRLHAVGLASGAAHAGNLVRTDRGWKMIDLSFKGPMIVCQGHDLLDMKRKFGVEIPAQSPALKIVAALVFLKYRWHLWRREFKKRLARR